MEWSKLLGYWLTVGKNLDATWFEDQVNPRHVRLWFAPNKISCKFLKNKLEWY